MEIQVTAQEVARIVGGAVIGGAMAVAAAARVMNRLQRTLIGPGKPDPLAPPIAEQMANVASSTSHTAGVVDQLAERMTSLEDRLESDARSHAEDFGFVKGRLDGIQGQVTTVVQDVTKLGTRVHGLESAKGWTPRQNSGESPAAKGA